MPIIAAATYFIRSKFENYLVLLGRGGGISIAGVLYCKNTAVRNVKCMGYLKYYFQRA